MVRAAVAEFAGTGTTGVKQCIHYEILEESKSIRHRSKLENLKGKMEKRNYLVTVVRKGLVNLLFALSCC